MKNIRKKTWIGFALNVAVAMLGCDSMAAQGGTPAAVLIAVAGVGILLTGAGIALLARGNPLGGVIGAVGSVFFIPIGLICLLGCVQSRDDLLRRKCAAPAADAVDSRDGAGRSDAGEPQAPPAQAAGPGRDGEAADAASAEKPLVAYAFADHSIIYAAATLVFIVALFAAGPDAIALVATIVVCAARFVVSLAQQRLYVCALYADHLDCASGFWSTSQIRIPYAGIVEAVVTPGKLRLVVEQEGCRTTVSVPFSLMPAKYRRQACASLADKMRELGVLRES